MDRPKTPAPKGAQPSFADLERGMARAALEASIAIGAAAFGLNERAPAPRADQDGDPAAD